MRVSSADQNEDRQKIELLTWGVPAGNLFCDKLSGKNFSRPEYQKLKTLLKKGDLLVVKSIDRLGRNYLQIQEEWRYITKKLEADIVIIDMPLLDTRRDKDLLGTLISDICAPSFCPMWLKRNGSIFTSARLRASQPPSSAACGLDGL